MTTEGSEYKPGNGWIETLSGRRFHFQEPDPDAMCIEDIAGAISKLCRYNGHCLRFYSVAEHCVLLAEAAQFQGFSLQTQYDLLMHDAAEAYLCDLPRPIKHQLAEYKAVEAKIERVMALKFCYQLDNPVVKEWDSRIIRDERDQNMSRSGNEWATDVLEPLGVRLGFWDPTIAEAQYLSAYDRLRRSIALGL